MNTLYFSSLLDLHVILITLLIVLVTLESCSKLLNDFAGRALDLSFLSILTLSVWRMIFHSSFDRFHQELED